MLVMQIRSSGSNTSKHSLTSRRPRESSCMLQFADADLTVPRRCSRSGELQKEWIRWNQQNYGQDCLKNQEIDG